MSALLTVESRDPSCSIFIASLCVISVSSRFAVACCERPPLSPSLRIASRATAAAESC